jgi:DNA polymerase-3 subunit epsilon
MDWREARVHVMDFEGGPRSGIVEAGVVTLYGGLVVESWTRFCAPTGELDARESRLHGIRETDTQDREPFSTEWERFRRMRRDGPFCAHHAPVEQGMLKAFWPYPGTVPDFARCGSATTTWGPWLDTRRIYERLYPDLDTAALGALVGAFGLAGRLETLAAEHCPPRRRKAHCALYDALASALLLLRLEEDPGLGRLSLKQLFNLSRAGGGSGPAQGELAL